MIGLSDWLADFDYELLDFGAGRKLERFGSLTLDRACPAADGVRQQATCWSADYVIDAKGRIVEGSAPDTWQIATPMGKLGLKLTPFGHVGVFPEQVENWHWLRSRSDGNHAAQPFQALNLFAYTGASTFALSCSDSDVTHVDASTPTVNWARENAKLSGHDDSVIRWLVEDARTYVGRALRRGKRYDLICLDPPSYGHSPKGKTWRIEADLFPLLDDCLRLLSDRGAMLLTGHSEEPRPAEIVGWLKERSSKSVNVDSRRLKLTTREGRELDAGLSIVLDRS